jgi:hypothetical protein
METSVAIQTRMVLVTMCVLRWITITPPVVRVGVPRQGAIMGAKPTVMVKVRLLMGVLAPMPKPN